MYKNVIQLEMTVSDRGKNISPKHIDACICRPYWFLIAEICFLEYVIFIAFFQKISPDR